MIRSKYPRPNFKRSDYQLLNGTWAFDFDNGNKYFENGRFKHVTPPKNIEVPFAYQTKASGINVLEHHEKLIYVKQFDLDPKLCNKNVLLSFNSVDFVADVYLNDVFLGKHIGGYMPFSFDVTECIKQIGNELVVRVEDKIDPVQPRGKQYWEKDNYGCWYNSDSGIIGSVWMEAFETDYISIAKMTPNIDKNTVEFDVKTAKGTAKKISVEVSFKNELVKEAIVSLDKYETKFELKIAEYHSIDELHYWDIDNPNLYDVTLKLFDSDNKLFDKVDTYFGFRKIDINEQGFICLNNKKLYQRLILDQGYFDDGDITALDEEAFKQDIEIAKELGFNGARKHQKVEDPYYYYYADKLGFLVWSELPSSYRFCTEEIENVSNLIRSNIENLYNHPSIITWVLFNESWGVRKSLMDEKTQNFIRSMYFLAKSLDTTRIVNSNDGWEQVEETDIIALHDYDPIMKNHLEKYNILNIEKLQPMGRKALSYGAKYKGQPVLMTEFGGLSVITDVKDDKFYGYKINRNEEEFLDNISLLIKAVYECDFQGFCYTQLTDVKQETNGLLFTNRKSKYSKEKIRKIILNE